MYLTITSIASKPHAARKRLDAQLLVDALWARAGQSGQVEHIATRTADGFADVGLYLRADSPAAADRIARDLLERVTRTAPILHGWYVR